MQASKAIKTTYDYQNQPDLMVYYSRCIVGLI